MKMSLAITLISVSISYGQINQKTVELRKKYAQASTLELIGSSPFKVKLSFENQSLDKNLRILSPQKSLKPSTLSIEKAFAYYNNQKKVPDLSGFVMMGYSAFTNRQFMNASQSRESLRVFPANVKD